MNIKNLISKYKPYNDQEEKDKETILKWIDSFDDVLTRNNEFAHFTSSAFIVNKERTKALMIYHNIYDSWAWTGGHVDGESNFLSVAIKEAKEETGIKKITPLTKEIELLDIHAISGHIKKGKWVSPHLHLSVAYLCEANDREIVGIKEDENSAVKWISLDEVVASSKELQLRAIYQKAIDKIRENHS